MFDNIEKENLIELGHVYREFGAVEVPTDKTDVAWRITRRRNMAIHARDLAAFLGQLGRYPSLTATDVENSVAGFGRVDRRRMRRRKAELEIVRFFDLLHVEFAVVEEVQAAKTRFDGRSKDIPRILHPIYVANLISVISGNRKFGDTQFFQHELNDDVGVEMKIIGVFFEWDLDESIVE